jgi:hypothetical protein
MVMVVALGFDRTLEPEEDSERRVEICFRLSDVGAIGRRVMICGKTECFAGWVRRFELLDIHDGEGMRDNLSSAISRI